MSTDHQTIRLACAGDERAMRQLWVQYAPAVDAVVRRLVGNADQAEDVAQEVWIQIFRALPTFRGESQFSTWAHRIAVNRTLNALRRLRRLDRMECEIEDDVATVEHDGDRAFLAASIQDALNRLPPGARTVFVLHDVEGYTHEEIATELGITSGGSKSQLFKARARLRLLLAHLVEDDGDQGGHPIPARSTTRSSARAAGPQASMPASTQASNPTDIQQSALHTIPFRSHVVPAS